MFTADYVDEVSRDKVMPTGEPGFQELGVQPQKVIEQKQFSAEISALRFVDY